MCDEADSATAASALPIDQDELTPLRTLLDRLDAAGQSGAVGYESLRRRLVAFFRLRVPERAEELADVTLERLARRLHDGTVIEHVAAFALGIARHVAMETKARLQRERLAGEEFARSQVDLAPDETEPVNDPATVALGRCLQELAPGEATFILAYYAEDGGAARIRHRQSLAAAHGLSENAARNRALRLRARLEKCVAQQLQTRPRVP
jgi:DNA-directed RNA polymerase specialized sigma24 family protein